MEKFYIFAQEIDNAPQSMTLFVEAHTSDENARLAAEEYTLNAQEWVYVTVASNAFETEEAALQWANAFKA